MRRSKILGIAGELVVAVVYLALGYALKGWRVRFGSLEADLLVRKRKRLVVVEVKAGTGGLTSARPERAFSFAKKVNLAKIASCLSRKTGCSVSVHLVAVDFSKIFPVVRRYREVCLW